MTDDEVTIRPAEQEDVAAIQQVARAAWLETYSDIHSREEIERLVDDWYAEEDLRREIDHEGVVLLVADRDGSVVGFVDGVLEDSISFFDLEPHEVEFRRIYVDPEHWRCGIGSALQEHADEVVARRGKTRGKTVALKRNDISHAFQERRGHERVETVELQVAGETYQGTVHAFDIPSREERDDDV